MKKYAEVLGNVISLSNVKKISFDKNISWYWLKITYTDGTIEEFRTTDYEGLLKDYENLKRLLLDEEYPIITKVGNNCEIHSQTSQDYDDLIANIKAEAYREFADELKKFAFAIVSENASEDFGEVVEVEVIENVLKELGVRE